MSVAARRRFFRQALAVARRDVALRRTYRASLVLGLLSGTAGLLSYFFVARLVEADTPALGGQGYFAFVCTGIALQGLVVSTIAALAGALARDANEGTLEPALAAGLAPGALLLGAALVPLGLALLQALLIGALATSLAALDLHGARPGVASLAALMTVLACAPLGVLGAAAWLFVRRPGPVVALATFALAFLGGIYFPPELLPEPLRSLSLGVPLAAGVGALRGALLEGSGLGASLPAFAELGAAAAFGLVLSAAVLRRALAHARRRGSLALV